MTERLFVYGTLRPPRLDTSPDDSRYYSQIADLVKAAVPARLEGAGLYDLGAYPAARPDKGEIVGELLYLEPQALTFIDRLEGHPFFYYRERVLVQTQDGPMEAWIYWAPEGLASGRASIEGGDWFRRQPLTADALAAVERSLQESAGDLDPALVAAVRRFAESDCSWLSSVRPSGRPHAAPVWHVWRQGRAYVLTIAQAIKVANIRVNPGVVITHPDPMSPVILEGWATFANGVRPLLRSLFQAKHGWDIEGSPEYDTVIEITPLKLLAWGEGSEGRWPGTDVSRVWLTGEG